MENKKMYLYNKYREVPDTAKKRITGGRLNGMTDINPMWRIKCLTEEYGQCGDGWFYEIAEHWSEKNESTGEIAVFVIVRLYLGEHRCVTGIGGSMLVESTKRGLYTNDEAYKMATTDAISVACKNLGFGADVYWQDDNTKYNDAKRPDEGRAITSLQASALVEKARRKGLVFDPSVYGKKDIKELSENEYHRAMNALDTVGDM